MGMIGKDKPFKNEVSPLGLLEQNSRRLANKLHERGSDEVAQLEAKQLPERQMPERREELLSRPPETTTFQNVQHPTAIVLDDTSSEWSPDDRMSIISRSDSVASRASGFGGGGILDSFRLSTLPDFAQLPQGRESVYSQYSTTSSARGSVYTARTSRDSVYSQRTIRHSNPAPGDDSDDSDAETVHNSPIEHPRGSFESARASGAFPPQILPQHRPLSSRSSVGDAASLYTAETHLSDRPARPRIETRLSMASTISPRSPSNFGINFQSFTRNNNSAPQLGITKSPHVGLDPSNLHTSPPTVHSMPKKDKKDGEEDLSTKLFAQMTAEEHVTTGIDLHEKGNLREAAYHWQYAAYKNDNTAMLLYGLAQRHGWGVRKNPTEAVKWLKRAMEKSIEEFAAKSPTSPTSEGGDLSRDMSWIKSILAEEEPTSKKKAHIGLALYELGMSYLHSWGTEKDEVMALKSFEMAGALGDADALCEAAGMYMKGGKGRKKDLQKAAQLYREAGERGANMVGQSWIYKDKYMDDKKKKKKH
ncbi:hypothetical protein TRVA0_025S02014 [Trichomonascus vanleenenianus]|uniref:tetratricopeptide repeat protein n=1 Tax=Trichomonascus vanleenenianus TaxID=2268995 RepID=UPI003ECB6FD6